MRQENFIRAAVARLAQCYTQQHNVILEFDSISTCNVLVVKYSYFYTRTQVLILDSIARSNILYLSGVNFNVPSFRISAYIRSIQIIKMHLINYTILYSALALLSPVVKVKRAEGTGHGN